MKKILAKKVNMTQIFDESGEVFPVTLLIAEAIKEGAEPVTFEAGEVVTVSGTAKGKGFQGVVKRHKFQGGRRSHGQKHSEREAGSIGGGGRAGGRVAKGMRMAGRMGNQKVTVKNLRVIKVDADTQEIYIRGAVPGRRGSKVVIKN
ncbi:50S ribosomal protein L3 [Candidatus Parcubacteria bacterium]|nr:50S ribosomal protein L3 [Candidatus Parcubacteria bacterium]